MSAVWVNVYSDRIHKEIYGQVNLTENSAAISAANYCRKTGCDFVRVEMHHLGLGVIINESWWRPFMAGKRPEFDGKGPNGECPICVSIECKPGCEDVSEGLT